MVSERGRRDIVTHCPYCRRTFWPIWAILLLTVALLAKDGLQTGFAFVAGRWFERGGLAKAWEKIADGAWKQHTERQLAEKGRR